MNFRKGRSRSRKNSTTMMVSTEKWKPVNNRRFSRRDTCFGEEDSDEDDPKYHEIKDWVQDFCERKSDTADKSDQDVEVKLTRKQSLILSTLVPDEILLMDKFDTTNPTRFVGVLLMADVSGYTALSERYNNTGKGGTYRLTVTLNTYLGALIELIYSHGGDILKFAGDAFLALWKTDKKTFLSHTIHTVIACALIIQHSYASYETDVKVNLRVKLAISAGNLIFSPIGTGIDMNYVVFGLPVIEAKAAESVCASGEVKLTGTAWGHCYSRNYDHIIHEDGHVTIKSILYDPHESDVTKPFVGFGPLVSNQIKKPLSAIENFPDFLWEPPQNMSVVDVARRNEALSLRKAILATEEKNLGSEIRKFMIRPVLTQIDAHQPLEYLTEMRQVSVLFLTLKPRDCAFLQLITIVNNAYQITCEIVYKSMGCVNKIILFDKDVMILVIFGLRGFKHESEAQAALKCAYSIKKSISALDGVLEVSIGVTTGQVYCGVVGHPLRREFTVIGAIVNKAARLMCGFRNKITCDESTFVKSKMSSNGFTLQPRTELKGIIHPGKIYEYSEEIRVKVLYDIPMTPPLLNRTDEMEYFKNWLDDSHLSYRDFDALLLVGDSRIGKSRMLEGMARHAQNRGFKVCFLNLTSVHSASPYLALSQIINQILGLKEPITGFIKEEKIIQLLKVYSDDLCFLNHIIKVRFAYHEGMNSLNETMRKEKAKQMFSQLIKAIAETHVIFMDDLQNLDSSSWEFVPLMFETLKMFTVLSVTRGKFSSVQNWLYGVFINNNIRKIVLGPLSSTWIVPLACQILDVNAVPNDLCNALRLKCNGMPGLIENFIVHLFSNGALELKKIREDELSDWTEEDFQFPDPELLHPQAINSKDQETLNELIKSDATGEIGICIVTDKEQLKTNINVQNIDALVMIQIDSLTPYQQLLLKIASVIGNVLSRDLLENIMYENHPLTTAKAVKRLFAMRIFCCANVKSNRWPRKSNVTSITTITSENLNLVCECCFDHDPELNENLPKYAYCKVMKFRNKNTRKTCYELLPLNQKKEFHSRIVNYLESNPQKCSDCGGIIMIIQSTVMLPEQQSSDLNSLMTEDEDSETSESGEELETNNAGVIESASADVQGSSYARKAKSESFYNPQSLPQNLSARTNSAISARDNARSNSNANARCTSILKYKNDEDYDFARSTTKRVTMSNLYFKTANSNDVVEHTKIFDMLRPVVEAKDLNDWQNLGAVDSDDECNEPDKGIKHSRKYLSVNIEKGVSQTNVSKCTCTELNIIITEQLIHHAYQAELKSKAVEFIIKFCHLNLLNNDFDPILDKLEEAEMLCLDRNIPESVISEFEKRRFLGKIHSIRAATFFMTEKLTAARLEIDLATRIYNINLHKVSELLKLRKMFSSIKRKKKRINDMLLKSDSLFCLNVATVLYSALQDSKVARIAAYRALEVIQNVDCNIIDICDAFSNAIQVEIDREVLESTVDIEHMASQVFRNLQRPIKIDELFAVGKFFMATFHARMARAELASTIRSGFRAITISRFLQADNISLDIIPDLFYVLLAKCRIEEAIDVLQLSLRLGQYQISHDCETWYYALCMDMILDAGFQLESPYEISRYAEYALHRGKAAGKSRRRLVVGLWTYWLRANFERKAKRFEAEALSWAEHDDDDGSLTTVLSALRLADGMLESLASKVDDLRKVVDLMELRSIADRDLMRLEKDARLNRVMYPRWLLLKGDSFNLSGRTIAANNSFNQALEEARRVHNRLEESLARAALSNSVFWTQNARAHRFPPWQTATEQARASWHQLMYKVTTTRQ